MKIINVENSVENKINNGSMRASTPTKNRNYGVGALGDHVDPISANGITLIALIITIIIMLILAGVVISLTIGDNGIFKTAKNAARNYADAAENENNQINEFENYIINEVNETEENPYTQLKVGDYVNYPVYYDNIRVQNSYFGRSWEPKDEYNGWRILAIDSKNKIVSLISAGIPLDYYHRNNIETSVGNLTANFFSTPIDSSSYYSFQQCGFKTAKNGTTITNINDLKTLFANDFTDVHGEGETYTDNGNTYTYTAGNPKVQSMIKADADYLWGSTTEEGTILTGASDLLVVKDRDAVAEAVPVWTSSSGADAGYAEGIWAIGLEPPKISGDSCYGPCGVRPVVTLKPNVKFTKASNNINNTQTWDIEI